MRILIVVVYYPPSTTSAAQMMRDLAVEFVRQGHQVMVATPGETAQDATTVTVEDDVRVVRIRAAEMRETGMKGDLNVHVRPSTPFRLTRMRDQLVS
jgi:hypothetical protein